MLTHTNVEIVLYAITVYQLLFFTIQLISFKKSNPARKYLGILLMGMTVFTVLNALFYTGVYQIMTWLYFFYIPLLLTLPPLYLLYIISLFKKNTEVSLFSRFVLFIPALLFLILNVFTFGLSPLQEKLLFLTGNHSLPGNSLSEMNHLLVIFWLGLFFLAPVQLVLAILRIRTILINDKYATTNLPAHLAYVQSDWVYIISFSLLVYFSVIIMQILFIDSNTLLTSLVFNFTVLSSTGLAGYYAMKQDALFTQVAGVGSVSDNAFNNRGSDVSAHNSEGNNKPPLSVDEIKEVVRIIENCFLQEKPYLNKRFSLNDLSNMTNINRSRLAYVINDVLGKNFYAFVNDYRVLEAIQIMKNDNGNTTIDAIADKAGFHTRSSFYACFKKYTGQTPREFMMENGRDGETER